VIFRIREPPSLLPHFAIYDDDDGPRLLLPGNVVAIRIFFRHPRPLCTDHSMPTMDFIVTLLTKHDDDDDDDDD
jgi:hypothetical protein